MADAPTRRHPIVNPEHAAACLRRLVEAWNQEHSEAFIAAMRDAHRLLGVREPVARPRKAGTR